MDNKPTLEYIFQHDINYGQEGECFECPYQLHEVDYVPYGEGQAPMESYDCVCTNASECVVAEDILEVQLDEWEAEQDNEA